jgi:hypothetical protein
MHLPLVEAVSPSTDQPAREKSGRGPVFWLVWLASLALLIWFLVEGYSYYSTPYLERPHHPDYRVFRPAGTMGLAFGYAGAAMMVLMLVYSIRKRTRLLGQKISLQSLLQFHIYLGVMGPLLIVLHTSFKVQGLVAVSFWSMAAVAASGFFGRYLYLQIPRNIEGSELTLQELGRVSDDTTTELRSRFHLDDGAIARLEEVTTRFVSGFKGGAFQAVLGLLVDDLFRFLARRRFAHEIRVALPLPRTVVREFTRMAFQRALLQRRVALLAQVQQIFHYWHVIHKPFAFIMYLIMLVHIGVAVWTGYGWVW